MRKLFITTGLFCAMTMGVALLNSCGDDDDCGAFSVDRVVDPESQARIITAQTDNQFETEAYNGASISIDDLGIEISYDLERMAMREKPITFGNRVFACSPPLLPNLMTNLVIVADQDYTADLPAGTSLNSIFQFSFDADTQLGAIDPDIFLDGQNLFFKLTTPPAENTDLTFTFRMSFEDGSSQEVSTSVIQLTR